MSRLTDRLVVVSQEEVLDLNYPQRCVRPLNAWCDFFLVDRRRRTRMRRRAKKQRRANARWWDQMFATRAGRQIVYAEALRRIVVYAPPRLAMSSLSGARATLLVLDDPHG